MILTGGPGTGKTTVIRGFVEVYAELHGLSLDPKEYAKKKEPFPIVLAAPTGQSSKTNVRINRTSCNDDSSITRIYRARKGRRN